MADADTTERAVGLAARYAARGLVLTQQQAEELASVVDRLDRMTAIVRAAAAAAARSAPRRP